MPEQERDPYVAERDFFDHLYQLWANTTKAENSFWQPQRYGDRWQILAVSQAGEELLVADSLSEQDADFITAVHGGFGEFIRRVHSALDEAETKDFDRDSRECRIAELELMVDQWEMNGGA